MEFLRKSIFSKNVWTLSIGMSVLLFAFSAYTSMFSSPRESVKIFLYILGVVLITFLGASLIVKTISRIINFRSLFKYFDIDPSWIFILALGSLFFSMLFGYLRFFTVEFFAGVFLLTFVPAILFRIFINFVISFPPGSKEARISIINE